MVTVNSEGKQAVSIFEPVDHYKAHEESPCLVRVILKTGRTHQIRVHAAHIDHPIAGDQKYGDSAFNQRMRALGLNRMFLHAAFVSFRLPESDEISVTAPLSDELQDFLQNLK
jgi:23S rRNA pseudouridine955/2504/2580 synthase